jgi:hypothetical protein
MTNIGGSGGTLSFQQDIHTSMTDIEASGGILSFQQILLHAFLRALSRIKFYVITRAFLRALSTIRFNILPLSHKGPAPDALLNQRRQRTYFRFTYCG